MYDDIYNDGLTDKPMALSLPPMMSIKYGALVSWTTSSFILTLSNNDTFIFIAGDISCSWRLGVGATLVNLLV